MLESREGPETCNTYNMLRLTEQLFASAPRAAYADYYERALYNHILASINPVTPGFVYFTPIRPEHYRVYSTPQQCFWCCVGTGMENHAKYGDTIYFHDDRSLYVNLFIPSELDWAEKDDGVHADLLQWHQQLIALRRSTPALTNGDLDDVVVSHDEDGRWLTLRRGPITVAVNLSEHERTVAVQGRSLLLASDVAVRLGEGSVILGPDSVAVVGG